MPDDKSRFVDPIDSFDAGPSLTGFELLQQEGLHIRPPGAITADQIRGCLWEMIYALAARRIFLSNTNHLDDRELYQWLHDEWLRRSNPDLPIESDCDYRVDILGTGSDADNQLWLRYYADEVFREIWARDFPEDSVPPCETAPFDRDRFLPRPAAQSSQDSAETDLAPDNDEDSVGCELFEELQDPLHLEAVDREIHREEPVFENEEADADGTDVFLGGADSADGLLREPAVGVETEHWQNPHDELMASGVILPPPEELTEEALPAKLWELLHEMACRGFYLLHTDHFSDRELYTRLWRVNLREPAILPGPTSGGGWYHDFVGSSSPEAMLHWLRYYANDLEREQHVRLNPDAVLPPREKCPFRRDHRLPKGPF